MKVRDSGMPAETMWDGFFDAGHILRTFGIEGLGDIAEFGCGYGTFTLPAAKLVKGTVYAWDIDPEMTQAVTRKAEAAGTANISVSLRDFVAEGTGLPDGSVDAALLFNILHHDQPAALLSEAARIVKTGGRVAVIQWIHDGATPRGPALDIRPKPEQCVRWGRDAGLMIQDGSVVDFPPYHYGLRFGK